MGPGSSFGEQSLLFEKIICKTTLRTVEKTTLAFLDRKMFDRALRRVELRVMNEKLSFF